MGVFDYIFTAILVYTAVTFYLLWKVERVEAKLLEYTADKTADYYIDNRNESGKHDE